MHTVQCYTPSGKRTTSFSRDDPLLSISARQHVLRSITGGRYEQKRISPVLEEESATTSAPPGECSRQGKHIGGGRKSYLCLVLNTLLKSHALLPPFLTMSSYCSRQALHVRITYLLEYSSRQQSRAASHQCEQDGHIRRFEEHKHDERRNAHTQRTHPRT